MFFHEDCLSCVPKLMGKQNKPALWAKFASGGYFYSLYHATIDHEISIKI